MSELGVGTAVAGYRIEGVVGQGSSGTVYSALELSLQRRVAVKILRPELAGDDRFRERFLHESRLAASLEHPNIIPIYAAGEADGSIYLAMRFVEGRDLARLIADEGALDPERAVELLTQVADALDAAHRSGLVHRDVKPGNVLVDAGGHAFLCDFGLAKHAVTVDSVTRDTPFAGTIDYVAPEQIHGDEIDARTDVYSLGCLFFECVSGAPPFRRQTDVAVVLAHLHEDPPSIREIMPELPAAFDDAVRRALAKAPEERFESAGELAEAARSALGDAGAGARPAARTPQLRTFLITDVRGYTRYTQEHGDEAGAELAATFAGIVREVVSRRDGRLLELRGDEALVVFESARKALQAATELQQEVIEAELPRGIGVGLDAGEAVAVGRGYRGAALNTAARLCSRARAGEILASEGVVHLAGKAEGVAYGLRRQERLKGYDRPVTAVEIHPVAQEPGRQLVRRIRTRLNATSPRTRVAAAALAFGAIASVVALTVVTGAGGRTLPANSVGALDIGSGDVSTVLGRDSGIEGLIAAEDGFWGIEAGGSVLHYVDARKRSLGAQLPLPASPYWFAPRVAFGSIWATDPSEEAAALWRFDAQYRRLSNTIKLPPGRQASGPQNAQGVDVTSDAVWVAYGYPKRLARVDPRTNDVRSWPVPGGGAFYDALVAADDQMVWVVDRTGRNLIRVDPKDGSELATGRLHEGEVTDVRVFGGYLWVAMRGDGGVWKIDETGAAVGKVPTGEVPWSLATGDGALWVANADDGTVTRIDPADDSTRQFRSGHRPVGVGVADGRVWITVSLSPAEARARLSGTKIVRVAVAGEPFFSSDPATFGGAAPFVLNHATGLRLMDYRTSPSGDARVVPEGAVAPPRVLDGGRTYVFRVREGFRFSPPSNEPVTAATFRYSIERTLSPQLSNTYCRDGLAGDIAGLEPYTAGKAEHVSGIVATGDELRITLVRPSSTLAARLAMPCFTAVPIGTPIAPDGLQEPIPSAGPYYVDSHLLENQTVIRKNPNYPGERPQRVDGVVFTSVASPQRGGELVTAGDADYAYDEGTPPSAAFAPLGRYERAYGAGQAGKPRYFRVPAALTRFLLLNTLDGPFANARYRRAAALAIDRSAIAKLVEGTPRGLLLPPGIPGYTARDPDARPRPDRAKALVGKGRPSIVLAAEAENPVNAGVTRQIEKELERVGFEVSVLLDVDPFELAKRPRPRVDALFTGWATDYPDPDGFFTAIFDTQEGLGVFPVWFKDARWLAKIRGAARLRGDARVRAYRSLDRELTSGPTPVIPLAVDNSPPQLFSARVRCQTFLPMFFGLVDPTSLCLE